MEEITERLYGIVLDRKANPSPDSYVCRLLERGEDKILQKVGEESVETILAAKGGDEAQLVHEIADLWFHLIVLLGARGIPPEKIAGELERRFGTSGLEEKRSRSR